MVNLVDSSTDMDLPKIYSLSETAICVEWEHIISKPVHLNVTGLNRKLNNDPFTGFIETVPSYNTLTVFFDPLFISSAAVKEDLLRLLEFAGTDSTGPNRSIKIPVCYDDEFGHDLEFIAKAHSISKEAVIAAHLSGTYTVYMMGFLPGFAYMGTVEDAIATARKSVPRALVEEGSVGIAGKQTGIYPLSSPGGWQIIGRTPLRLFDLRKPDPFLFSAGDEVRFESISKKQFKELKEQNKIPAADETTKEEGDIIVVKPGIYSIIQDGGRFGYRSFGVPVSGAMDLTAFHLANALAGNTKNAACIECTLGGIQLRFKKNTVIAVTGFGIATINGRPIRICQPLAVFKNDLLEIKFSNEGVRSYIAVRGGFDSTLMLNSRSVYPKAGIGLPLKKDDGLKIGNMISGNSKMIPENFSFAKYQIDCTIQIIEGPEFKWMDAHSRSVIFSNIFLISNQSDRMGYRLESEPLVKENNIELLSTAVTKGTVQLTPSGQLIILMSDCQTTGGYPRVAQVAASDLSILAQMKPGDGLRFKSISLAAAESLYLSEQKMINALFD